MARRRRSLSLVAVRLTAVAAVVLAAGPVTKSERPRGAGASLKAREAPDRPRAQAAPDPRGVKDNAGAARRREKPVRWRNSVAIGVPEAGRLVRGVQLPRSGRHHFTWDPILRRRPDRPWRRWGTDFLVRTVLRVARDFARAHPRASRIGVGDLSLPRGGDFGPEVGGGIGHSSHQNGLDVDVYYPLRSGDERAPRSVGEVSLRLSQELVDRFVAAGAVKVFVGPSTPLTGPPSVVVPAANHDNHLHARFAP